MGYNYSSNMEHFCERVYEEGRLQGDNNVSKLFVIEFTRKWLNAFKLIKNIIAVDSIFTDVKTADYSVVWRRYLRASRGGGGGACSLVPYKNLQLFPCSSKINWGVPRNSLLLNSHVPRNYAPCSLNPQNIPHCSPQFLSYLVFIFASQKEVTLQLF